MKRFIKSKEKFNKNIELNKEFIEKLNQKEKILNSNTHNSRISIFLACSIVPAILVVIPLAIIGFNITLPYALTAPLIYGLPIISSITFEQIINKRMNKLKRFSKTDTQFEIIEEQIELKIEQEKLLTLNNILNKVIDKINEEEKMLNQYSGNYNISEKMNLNNEELYNAIEKQIELIDEEQEKLDLNILKKVLKEQFGTASDKFYRRISHFEIFCIALVFFAMWLYLPFLISNIQLSLGKALITIFLIPSILSTITTGVNVKLKKELKDIYDKLLKKYNIDKIESFDKEKIYEKIKSSIDKLSSFVYDLENIFRKKDNMLENNKDDNNKIIDKKQTKEIENKNIEYENGPKLLKRYE